MKPITFNGGFRFNDPNLRWGNPSFQLEPGDPGYVDPNPPPTPNPQPTRKHKAMPKQPFLPTNEPDQVVWLGRFTDTLKDAAKGYATKYDVSAASVTKLDTGRQHVDWAWANLEAYRTASKQGTANKDQLFTGSGALATAPTAPVLPAPPAGAAFAGVMSFATTLANGIKNHPNYSEADGLDLGLEGATVLHTNVPTPPTLTLLKAMAGSVSINWNKNRHQGAKFQGRPAGSTDWADVGLDLTPPFDDARPLAHPGVPEVREYRACHVDKEIPTNLWSDVLVVTVTP